MRHLATIFLPLKYWKIVEISKISIKIKNFKTFYEAQTASQIKEIIQPH